MIARQDHDVVILGAGPAGCTAATLLAQEGVDVGLVEKRSFPRYSVGESLLPYCYFTLERLGVLDCLEQSHFPRKYSVQFVTMDGRVSQPFYFDQHLDHPAAVTWQVVRSEFDQMLLDRAGQEGVKVYRQTHARELLQDTGGTVTGLRIDQDGVQKDLKAKLTMDASGRNAFAANRLGWRVRDPQLKKVALWTYFKGATRDPGRDAGATTVAYLPEKGWFWFIPLPDDLVSVGIVCEREYLYRRSRKFEEIFCHMIGQNRWIAEHLEPAQQQGEYHITGDYSYRSRYCATNGLVLIGDAFAFLDPVFSSGVFLALKSGELAADTAVTALRENDVSGTRFEAYGSQLRQSIEAMRRLVYAFYDPEFRFKDLIMKYPHLQGDLTDCLIGNLEKDFTELFQAVAEFAEVPAPLEHGMPQASHSSVGRA